MDADDPVIRKPDALIVALARQDLDPLSIAELDARVAALETEIARTRDHAERAVNHRATADALFRR